MKVDAYRLWQKWQAMHYPRRGVPDGAGHAIDLVALDGSAGVVLERYFCRGPQAKALDAESLAALDRCRRELGQVSGLASDAGRYFGRLSQLIEMVLGDSAHAGDIDKNGLATSEEEAQGRPVPS